MDHRFRAEQRMQEHFDYVARINAGGWKTAALRKRPQVKRVVARALVALAVRLDWTLAMPVVGGEHATPATR